MSPAHDPAPPADFDGYWQGVDDELAGTPPGIELEHLALRSSDIATVYRLRATSIGPYQISGYVTVPAGPGPFPGLLLTPRYGSVNHVPHADDQRRFVALQLIHRGQRLADEPFSASYPGLLTVGIDDPATWIYRAIVADCVRGLEVLRALPNVDLGRIGIVGDDLALVTAARRPDVSAVVAADLLLHRAFERAAGTLAYPVGEIGDHLRARPGSADDVRRTLERAEPRHHAGRVRAAVLLPSGEPGSVGGPEWLAPLTDALGGRAELYPLTFEGATDRDWIDAWLSARLGVPAAPRLWDYA